MSDRDSGNGVLWFLAGLGLGAALGVLYAPRSGRETRQALLDAAEEGRDYLNARGRDAKERMGEWTAKGREVLDQQKEKFRAAYESGRQAYRETAEKKS